MKTPRGGVFIRGVTKIRSPRRELCSDAGRLYFRKQNLNGCQSPSVTEPKRDGVSAPQRNQSQRAPIGELGEPAAVKSAKMQGIGLRIFGGSEPPPYENRPSSPQCTQCISFAAGDIMREAPSTSASSPLSFLNEVKNPSGTTKAKTSRFSHTLAPPLCKVVCESTPCRHYRHAPLPEGGTFSGAF